MMGSRSGSVDPGILLYLLQQKGYSYEHWLARQPLSAHTRRTYLTQASP